MPHPCMSAQSRQHKAHVPWEADGWGKALDTKAHLASRRSITVELEQLTTIKQEKHSRETTGVWLSPSAKCVHSQICQGAVPSRGIRYAFSHASPKSWLAKLPRVTAEAPKQQAPLLGQKYFWQPLCLVVLLQHTNKAQHQVYLYELY